MIDFDAYWRRLIERVHHGQETLIGSEVLFYRWSGIYGETMVDGIEAYFERRMIPRLESLAEFKYAYGLREGLYAEDNEP